MKRALLLLAACAAAAAALAEPCAVSPSFSLVPAPLGGIELRLQETTSSAATYAVANVQTSDNSTFFVTQPVTLNTIAQIEHGTIVCHTASVDLGPLQPGEHLVHWKNAIAEPPLPSHETSYDFHFTIDPPPDCNVALQFQPRIPDSTAPFTVIFSNMLAWPASAPIVTIDGNRVVVTERADTNGAVPPPGLPPCSSRHATIPKLAQGSYELHWQVLDATGRTITHQIRQFDVAGPVYVGNSNEVTSLRRTGPLLVVTGAGAGQLHIHYESQPRLAYSAAPQFQAQFIGAQLRVTQPMLFGDLETYPDDANGTNVKQVEDFDLPAPPPGDYILLWNQPPMAFRVEPDLPSTQCGLQYDAKFAFAGDRMLMTDFYSGVDPRFETPAVTVDGSEIRVVQEVSDGAVQYNGVPQTTRCHDAAAALPPLAPGTYHVVWIYRINGSIPRPASRITTGTLEVRARRRSSGH